MPTKVAVNSNQIAINDGSSFLVTASDGSIAAKNVLIRGETATTWKDGILSTEYRNGDFSRGTVL